MKLKSFVAPLCLSLIFCSCKWAKKPDIKAAIAKDTLKYQYQTFKQRADDCGNKPDSSCTVVTIKYPVFKNEGALNDSVRLRLAKRFPQEKADTSWKNNTAKFMDAYKADVKTNSRKGMFYTLDGEAAVVRQDSGLTTIQIDSYAFSGGAHGMDFTDFINWDTQSHKNLTLSDVLVDNYLPRLNQIAEKIFRQQEKLSDTASLARDYFFKDARFSVNNNFLITPVGIRFLYNVYEIKPYAAGQTDLLVPYTQIKKLLKPNTVIAQYLR